MQLRDTEIMIAWSESRRYSISGLTMDGIIITRDCQVMNVQCWRFTISIKKFIYVLRVEYLNFYLENKLYF